MIKYLDANEWKVIESSFHPQYQRSSESIFSIGNGKFGQRANFEEYYSGDHHQGAYIAGIYYPDKTKVGWWKNGYPEYFAKVLNSVNWIGIDLKINKVRLDLNTWTVERFERVLDMKTGVLQRAFKATEPNGGFSIEVETKRICSMADDDCGVIQYKIKTSEDCSIEVLSYLDSDVENQDTNWDEKFWNLLEAEAEPDMAWVKASTKKTNYFVAAAMVTNCTTGDKVHKATSANSSNSLASQTFLVDLEANEWLNIEKHVGICSSLNHEESALVEAASNAAQRSANKGVDAMFREHAAAWDGIWENGDIIIKGDTEAQQGIRFNIFHLNQTYTGEDARLNIGPKGFTGEKYGGSTYWDTEAYCLPFYLSTHPQKVAKQLLKYRFEQLDKAIENAEKLGFKNGAALYPMVTMTGEECHNEWEITFEEIHRNGAIAFAIYNYTRFTGDKDYIAESGFDVVLGIARFWAQRVNWSENKQAYVMLGVTGPNEYENNVNNNWYTNYIAKWCLSYALKCILYLKDSHETAYAEKCKLYNFKESEETQHWADIIEKMYLPKKANSKVFLQQDGFLDKELVPVAELPEADRPINQKWSWDRILRSVYIKQADTLQGIYLFEDHFDLETIKENFDFYEPFTVHESSLSPCVHVVIAALLGYEEKAYEMYLRTSRLDLDDYNHEAYQGLHITSMAGTWMSVVEGFGGYRVKNGVQHFNTMIPKQWKSYSFSVMFKGRRMKVEVSKDETVVKLLEGDAITVFVNGQEVTLS